MFWLFYEYPWSDITDTGTTIDLFLVKTFSLLFASCLFREYNRGDWFRWSFSSRTFSEYWRVEGLQEEVCLTIGNVVWYPVGTSSLIKFSMFGLHLSEYCIYFDLQWIAQLVCHTSTNRTNERRRTKLRHINKTTLLEHPCFYFNYILDTWLGFQQSLLFRSFTSLSNVKVFIRQSFEILIFGGWDSEYIWVWVQMDMVK